MSLFRVFRKCAATSFLNFELEFLPLRTGFTNEDVSPSSVGLSVLSRMISLASVDAQVTRGFDRKIPAFALNAEISRQPTLWVMEVQIKPMRMIWVNMKDTKSGRGETSGSLVPGVACNQSTAGSR